ncbi:hypothetical protein DERP_000672 [Dermatophagoides pteronyssinus]|uniref:Uncharacterized protein n=1 Tax=Dermatophagoides pteronyssinus TaxID=6956 RepID=A0ABQ8J1C7_DERPT|nr:hypothetical protein DERP_000672 [Dermatophagoides pteronyssinus]
MNPIQLPDADQCKQLDHYGHIELILDMGLDYGFSIFINYDHNDGVNKSNTCNYTCINSFTGNFRPIQSKNKSLQICQQTSEELCQHFIKSNIFINNVRMIFILNKTFYYFLFNDKKLYSYTVDHLPITFNNEFKDFKNISKWFGKNLNDYHIKTSMLIPVKQEKSNSSFIVWTLKETIDFEVLFENQLNNDNNQQQQQQPKQFAQINKTDIDYDRIRQIYLIKQQISNRLNNFDLILFQQQSYSTIRFCRDCKKSKMYPPLSTLPMKTIFNCPINICFWPLIDSIVYSESKNCYYFFQGRYLFTYNVSNNQLKMSQNPFKFNVQIIQNLIYGETGDEIFLIIYMDQYDNNQFYMYEYSITHGIYSKSDKVNIKLSIDQQQEKENFRLITGLIDYNEHLLIIILEIDNKYCWKIFYFDNGGRLFIEKQSYWTTLPITSMFINKYIHLLIGSQIFILKTTKLSEFIQNQNSIYQFDCIRLDFVHYINCWKDSKLDDKIEIMSKHRLRMFEWFKYYVNSDDDTIITSNDKNFIKKCRLITKNDQKNYRLSTKKGLEQLNFQKDGIIIDYKSLQNDKKITDKIIDDYNKSSMIKNNDQEIYFPIYRFVSFGMIITLILCTVYICFYINHLVWITLKKCYRFFCCKGNLFEQEQKLLKIQQQQQMMQMHAMQQHWKEMLIMKQFDEILKKSRVMSINKNKKRPKSSLTPPPLSSPSTTTEKIILKSTITEPFTIKNNYDYNKNNNNDDNRNYQKSEFEYSKSSLSGLTITNNQNQNNNRKSVTESSISTRMPKRTKKEKRKKGGGGRRTSPFRRNNRKSKTEFETKSISTKLKGKGRRKKLSGGREKSVKRNYRKQLETTENDFDSTSESKS